MNYLDYLETVERAHPDRVAVREGEQTWTYAALLDDARAGANALADAGVGAGDAVMLMAPNTYGFVTATLATLARRAVLVPVNVRFREREVANLADQVGPVAAIAGDAELPVVTDALGAVAGVDAEQVATFRIATEGEGPAPHPEWGDTIATASPDYVVPETMGEREALVLHTSGSTGRAKAAVHTHANLAVIADASIANYEMRPGSTFLAVMPLYHCTGMGTILGATLKVGGVLLLYCDWEPEATLRAVADHDVEVFSGVPAMFKDWLAVAETGAVAVETSSMHTGIIGGAGVSADLIRRSEAFLGCPVLNGWGMTETFAAGLWEDRRTPRTLPSVGQRSGRLFEVRVVDPDTGEELPDGESGELLVRGEAMMTEYLEHDATWTDDWLHTGDYARIDDDGFVYILDRVAYTIITGGENVFPQEVEGVIEELDGVREAAVVGKPDARKGEKPVAFVDALPSADADEAAVKSYVLDQLAAYKHPRAVYFVDELPRNAIGKVDRPALEKRL